MRGFRPVNESRVTVTVNWLTNCGTIDDNARRPALGDN